MEYRTAQRAQGRVIIHPRYDMATSTIPPPPFRLVSAVLRVTLFVSVPKDHLFYFLPASCEKYFPDFCYSASFYFFSITLYTCNQEKGYTHVTENYYLFRSTN